MSEIFSNWVLKNMQPIATKIPLYWNAVSTKHVCELRPITSNDKTNYLLIIHCYTSRAKKKKNHLYGDVNIAGEGLQNLGRGRDLFHATPAVTRDLGFSSLLRRVAPFSHLLRHTRGCEASILTRILTGYDERPSSTTIFCHICIYRCGSPMMRAFTSKTGNFVCMIVYSRLSNFAAWAIFQTPGGCHR
jgi:hypothetical protein